jgi:uncharacterized protein (DUF4213/DUF364 family)
MNALADEFIHLATRVAARFEIAPIRRLLMPGARDSATKDADFLALELADGTFGLSYAWLPGTLARERAGPDAASLEGMPAIEIARWYAEADGLRRAIGLAAINAISQACFRLAGRLPESTVDSIALLAPAPGDHVGMIGLFPPLVERILASGARLTVAELDATLAGPRDRYRVTLDAAELSGCNKVISTSTLLLNDTLAHMLDVCRGAGYFAIVGPTAGCLPDPLFSRGVDTLGGTRVVDPGGFARALVGGEPWGRHAQKYCLRRADYPGVLALLQ